MGRVAAIASFGLTIVFTPAVSAQSTPTATDDPCVDVAGGTPASATSTTHEMPGDHGMMGTPEAGMPAMDGPTASPMAGMDMDGMDHAAMDLDLMYIDMMVPHHASIIAMAEAALPRLEDERLRELAQAVIATQQPEIEELGELRERFYGDVPAMPMDGPMMAAMDEMMPGMGDLEEMAFQMDAAAQVAAICAAEDADRAFIDLTIPHHEMAVVASRRVVERGAHPEVRDFAQRVIDAQQREIETLAEIRRELYGSATPEPVAAGS